MCRSAAYSAAAVSAAPTATGMPGVSPSSLAGPGSNCPATSVALRTGGSFPAGRPSAAITPSAQTPRARSNRSVPDASVGSVAARPVSRIRTQSFGCNAHRARCRTSGSCAASHDSIGPAIPADA